MWQLTFSCMTCNQSNPEDLCLWFRTSSTHKHLDELKALKGLLPTPLFRLSFHMLRQAKERRPSIVVKIFPRPRWRHVSLAFQLSEKHQSSPLNSMLYLTSSRSSPLRDSLRSGDFSSDPSSSNNKSPLISANSYADLLSSTFIMCTAT